MRWNIHITHRRQGLQCKRPHPLELSLLLRLENLLQLRLDENLLQLRLDQLLLQLLLHLRLEQLLLQLSLEQLLLELSLEQLLLQLRLEQLLLQLRLEQLLLQLLQDDGLHDTMDGRAPDLLGDLCQLLAALLLHHLAAALLQDLRPEERHLCHWAALLHEELPAWVQLLLQNLQQLLLLLQQWLLL